MIKLTILLRRRAGLSHEQFVEYHRDQHAPLFMSTPVVQDNVRRYVQQHTVDVGLDGLPPTTIDGITELWFDDIASMAVVFGDATYLEVIRPDEGRFLDLPGCEFVLSEETVVAETTTR